MVHSDEFSLYETGLERLLGWMKQYNHPRLSEALNYEQRLRDNITKARRHGDTETLTNERTTIIDRLTELTLATRNLSFLDLCRENDPAQHRFPDSFGTATPHPIAVCCHRFNQAAADSERFVELDRLINNTVKYLTAIAVSQYWQDHPDKHQLRLWVGALSQPHLFTSLTLLNRISDQYAAGSERSPLHAILFAPYTLPVDAASPIVTAYRRIRERQLAQPARDEDITPRTFLTRLLQYRETNWEGNPSHINATLCADLLAVVPVALHALLDQFQHLLRYPLYYIEYIDSDQTAHEQIIALTMFPGAAGKAQAVDPLLRVPQQTDAPVKLHRLYLCSPDRTFWLNLHPFLVAHLHELYFLEQQLDQPDAGADIWFARCAPPERHKRPAYALSLFQQSLDQTNQGNVVAEFEEVNAALEQEENPARFQEMSLDILLNTYLSDTARQALAAALGESLRIGHFWLGVEFLLMGLSRQRGSLFGDVLHTIGLEPGELRGVLRSIAGIATDNDWRRINDVERLGSAALPTLRAADPATLAAGFDPAGTHPPVVTPRLLTVLRAAAQQAATSAGNASHIHPRVDHAHLLLATLTDTHSLAVNVFLNMVAQAGAHPQELLAWIAQCTGGTQPDIPPLQPRPPHGNPDVDHPPRPVGVLGKGVLAKLGRDLTALAKAGDVRPAIGSSAHKAMLQVGLILQQTQANNPLLLGDPGVGKTAIVEGFAHRLATDPKVIPQLASRRIIDLPLAALMAGTRYRGDLEERVQQILHEVRSTNGQTIIFIDEIHTILGNKSEGGMAAVADALKPALARGEFPCIGATTVAEYRRYIESDPALARRFTPVWLEEPTSDEAIAIAAEVARSHLTPRHGVEYPDAVIKEAVHLAVRYIHDEFLPGKAIKLLDQAGPQIIMGGSLSGVPDPDAPAETGQVTVEVIRAIVATRTGIPLARLTADDKQQLLHLEQTLQQRVIGQDDAIAQVARVIKRARAGLANPRRPLGVFLFAGPTGVGKTELALALAEALFGQEDAILRLDMSEFMEKHQVARLIGSPPGYVGYHEEGQLTGRLRRRPYSVVLLDEMEKAHKEVQHLFLQLFDSGRITDASGKLADGRNAIFIMTTNLGARDALGFAEQRTTYQQKLQQAIETYFTAEFLNRIDRIVYFNPLDDTRLLTIFDKLFAQVAARFREQQIEVQVPESVKRALCRTYLDKHYGARYLERAIEDEIVAPLIDRLLAGEITPGMTVIVPERDAASSGDPPAPAVPPQPAAPGRTAPGPLPFNLDLSPPIQRTGAQQPVPPPDQEAQNRATFDRMWQELQATMENRGITVELDAAVSDLLCSPALAEQREGKNTMEAFVAFVEMPLTKQFTDQQILKGDRVRVYCVENHIEFKRIQEGDVE